MGVANLYPVTFICLLASEQSGHDGRHELALSLLSSSLLLNDQHAKKKSKPLVLMVTLQEVTGPPKFWQETVEEKISRCKHVLLLMKKHR